MFSKSKNSIKVNNRVHSNNSKVIGPILAFSLSDLTQGRKMG